jgi:hypothetical protein
MADDFRMARFKASLLNGRMPGPPRTDLPAPRLRVSLRPKRPTYTPEEAAQLLIKAVTMQEIGEAAALLGLTFKEAYAERGRLYTMRWGV